MHLVVRTIGKMLRLVGISSPEDCEAKASPKTAAGPPSWRNTRKEPAHDDQTST